MVGDTPRDAGPGPMAVDGGGCLSMRFARNAGAMEHGRVAMRAHLEAHAVDERAIYGCELVYEELVINAIRYASGPSADHAPIDVSVRVRSDEVELVIEDESDPFDVVTVPEPQRAPSLAQARIGGLGLVLVRRTARRFEYEREGERNRVTASVARSAAA